MTNRQITLDEIIAELTELRKTYSGSTKVTGQSHGCCLHGHYIYLVEPDEACPGEIILRC